MARPITRSIERGLPENVMALKSTVKRVSQIFPFIDFRKENSKRLIATLRPGTDHAYLNLSVNRHNSMDYSLPSFRGAPTDRDGLLPQSGASGHDVLSRLSYADNRAPAI